MKSVENLKKVRKVLMEELDRATDVPILDRTEYINGMIYSIGFAIRSIDDAIFECTEEEQP